MTNTVCLFFLMLLEQNNHQQQVDACVSNTFLFVTNPNDGIIYVENSEDKYAKLKLLFHGFGGF